MNYEEKLREELELVRCDLHNAYSILEGRNEEIERLNNIIKQQQEDIEEYNDKLNEVVKERNKYLHIINEFDKWLLGEKMMFYKGSDGETLIRYGETISKWLELKGSDKNG